MILLFHFPFNLCIINKPETFVNYEKKKKIKGGENKADRYREDEDIGRITTHLKHYHQLPSRNLCLALRHVSFNELLFPDGEEERSARCPLITSMRRGGPSTSPSFSFDSVNNPATGDDDSAVADVVH